MVFSYSKFVLCLQLYEQQLSEVQSRKTVEISEIDGELKEKYEARMHDVLQELREQYEDQLSENRAQIEALYETKVSFDVLVKHV